MAAMTQTPISSPCRPSVGLVGPGAAGRLAGRDGRAPAGRPARVIEQHRTHYVVADGPDASIKAESLPEWQRPRFPSHERPAVGDWVLLDGIRIVALLPRRTAIKRGAA